MANRGEWTECRLVAIQRSDNANPIEIKGLKDIEGRLLLKINRSEVKFVLKWSTLVVAVSTFPYLYTYLTTPPGMYFAGWLGSPADHNIYLMWMRQAQEGHWLFENRMTTEPHRPILFLPFWLMVGRLAGWLQISPIIIYHFLAVVASFVLLMMVYFFAAHFFATPLRRKTALVLISLSSGFGWFFGLLALWTGDGSYLLQSIDLRAHEAITFRILHQNLHTTFAVAVMLGAMTCLWQIFKTKRWPYALVGGVLALAVAGIHPQDVVSMALSVLIFLLLLRWKERNLPLHLVKFYGVAFLWPLPLLGYYYYLGTREPVWQDTISRAPLPAGNALEYIYGYGLIWPFALLGLWVAVRKKRAGGLFLLAWVVATALLLTAPVSQPIRFLEGVHIPLVMLMTYGLLITLALVRTKLEGWRNYSSFARLRLIIIGLVVLVTVPTNLALILNSSLIHGHLDDFPTYINLDMLAGINWLETHTAPSEPVLASFVTSNMLPGRSGNKVFAADWTHTLNAEQKRSQVKWFFQTTTNDQQRHAFLEAHGIRYLFYSHLEDALGNFKPGESIYLKPRYENASVTIYEVVGGSLGSY